MTPNRRTIVNAIKKHAQGQDEYTNGWDVVVETLSGPVRQDGVVRGRPRRVAKFVKTDPRFLATLPECFYDLPDGVTSYDEAVAYDREHAKDEDANAKAGMSEEATA